MQIINDEWWIDARVCDNATIARYANYACDFAGGNWYGGTFKWGTWSDGNWHKAIWHDGTWENGTWERGTWLNGTWVEGDIYYGFVKQYDYKNSYVSPKVVFKPKLTLSLNHAKYIGIGEKIECVNIRRQEDLEIELDDENPCNKWYYGEWHGGNWDVKDWHSGIWYDGIWYKGVWNTGIWLGGIWKDGNWNGGIWVRGIWTKGSVINIKTWERIPIDISPKTFIKPKRTLSLNYANYK